jgi:type I restriction enzyme S subunit
MSWVQSTLGEVADIFSGYAFKSADMNSEGGTPLIKIKNIADSAVSHECDAFLNKDFNLAKFERFHLLRDDFLVAMTGQGSVGRIGKMRDYKPGFYVNQRVAIVRVNPEKANPVFIFYQIATRSNELELFKKANGAGQPNISAKQIGELPVVLPSTEQQQYIADVLSSYDDLIENNQKQIKLLEEAAQRLYKEWFVDLRFPGYENTPLVDGVPEGWQLSTVGECSVLLRRGISPKYAEDGPSIVINQKCIRQSVMDLSEARKQEKPFAAEMNLMDSDTVICSTGAGTLGRVGQVFGEYPHTTFDSHVTLVRASDAIGKQYLYQFLKAKQDYLQGMGKGSTNQLELSRGTIQELPILVPYDNIQRVFEQQMQPIHDKITALTKQIKLLCEARDSLLPKLMNGEIEV